MTRIRANWLRCDAMRPVGLMGNYHRVGRGFSKAI